LTCVEAAAFFSLSSVERMPKIVAAGPIVVTGLAFLMVACGQPTATAPAPTAPSGPSIPPVSSSEPAAPNAPETNAAGDIPDNQAYVPFAAPDGLFKVSVPEGWARRTDGAATLFTDKYNSVRIESTPAAAAPDAASANATEVPKLQSTVPGYQPGKVTATQRKSGPVLVITYGATSAPDPVTGKTVAQAVERYEFWKSGTEVIVTLSGAQGADNVDPWRTVTDSFAWQR
jgi:hypothetical protein